MIPFERYDHIKVEDALKYIDSLPWEGQEFDDITPLDNLKVILKADKYEDFASFGQDDYEKNSFDRLGKWLHTPRHVKMQKGRKELLDWMMEGEPPITEAEMAKVTDEWYKDESNIELKGEWWT